MASVLDLEVPGEVRQHDFVQLTLQSHQPLPGHCGQTEAGSQCGPPASLPSEPFSGSCLPWGEKLTSLLTVIAGTAHGAPLVYQGPEKH